MIQMCRGKVSWRGVVRRVGEPVCKLGEYRLTGRKPGQKKFYENLVKYLHHVCKSFRVCIVFKCRVT